MRMRPGAASVLSSLLVPPNTVEAKVPISNSGTPWMSSVVSRGAVPIGPT
ncbi:hypothetical protein ACFWB2_12940 [Streptomyces virginiae]